MLWHVITSYLFMDEWYSTAWISILFFHLSTDGRLFPPTPHFLLLWITLLGILCTRFWAACVFNSLGHIPRSRIPVVTAFHSGCTILRCYQQCPRAPISLCSLSSLFTVSDIRHITYHRKTFLSYGSLEDLFWHVLLLKWFTSEKYPQMQWLESWMSHRTPKA